MFLGHCLICARTTAKGRRREKGDGGGVSSVQGRKGEIEGEDRVRTKKEEMEGRSLGDQGDFRNGGNQSRGVR